jgi:hypothetical protein
MLVQLIATMIRTTKCYVNVSKLGTYPVRNGIRYLLGAAKAVRLPGQK